MTNVPLSLKEWSLDTRLLGRKALVASITRHYISQCLIEAHKVHQSADVMCCGRSSAANAYPAVVTFQGRRALRYAEQGMQYPSHMSEICRMPSLACYCSGHGPMKARQACCRSLPLCF